MMKSRVRPETEDAGQTLMYVKPDGSLTEVTAVGPKVSILVPFSCASYAPLGQRHDLHATTEVRDETFPLCQ
ncbi:hypothetical protein DMH04_10230 [Kibdelosporangium aridum]|uniref:Uncharacterized protein n=1 Tax=Kibdelosporangium aridum TaxID=2030 RepID=A0A428ZHH5_KIBAR|nr:hypothetical protein DMH04_10230 [Kibdelosporangium aridum]